MLKTSGFVTPEYDEALQTEAALTGEDTLELMAKHRVKLAKFWGLFALTQGMRRAAEAAFDNPDSDFNMLVNIAGSQRNMATVKLRELTE